MYTVKQGDRIIIYSQTTLIEGFGMEQFQVKHTLEEKFLSTFSAHCHRPRDDFATSLNLLEMFAILIGLRL